MKLQPPPLLGPFPAYIDAEGQRLVLRPGERDLSFTVVDPTRTLREVARDLAPDPLPVPSFHERLRAALAMA